MDEIKASVLTLYSFSDKNNKAKQLMFYPNACGELMEIL